MPEANMGMNIAQTNNAASTMSQYQHSQKQTQQSSQTSNSGIFRRIPPLSILPQLFEINIINILSGNIESATSFLLDSIALDKLGIANFVEKHEQGLFSTLNIIENPLYAGEILFPQNQGQGGEGPDTENVNSEDANLQNPTDQNSDNSDNSDNNYRANERNNNALSMSEHIDDMHDADYASLGNLSPKNTPKMPESPFQNMDDSMFEENKKHHRGM